VPTPPGLRAENIRIEREVQLTFEEGNLFSSWIAWSPDGDKVLVNKYNGQTIQGENVTFLLTDIWEISLSGGASRQVVSNAYGGIWSPNGWKLLYFSLTAPDRQDIYVSDEDGTNAIKIASGSPTPAWWLNDANIVYVDQGRLWVANVAQRRSQILNEHLDLTPARANRWNKPYALSPESERLAYIDGFRLFAMGISEAPGHPIADNVSPGSYSKPNLAGLRGAGIWRTLLMLPMKKATSLACGSLMPREQTPICWLWDNRRIGLNVPSGFPVRLS
jgi:hypothetical protein